MNNQQSEALECPPDSIQIIPEGFNGHITSGAVTNCVIMKAEYEYKGYKVFAMGHFYRNTYNDGNFRNIIADFEKETGLKGGSFRVVGENGEFRNGNKNIVKTFEMTFRGIVVPKTLKEIDNIKENILKFYK